MIIASVRSRSALLAAGLFAGLVLLSVAHSAVDVPLGLRADYFDTLLPGADPSRSIVSPEVSTPGMVSDWGGAPPETFRARWFGYLTVVRPGLYTFATTSDDGSSLMIDGVLVVDNGGVRGNTTRTGQVTLDRGPHLVVIEYVQAGGFFNMEWLWARGDAALAPVPGWVLTPARQPAWRVVTIRTIGLLWWAVAVLTTLAALWAAGQRSGPVVTVLARHPRTASLALFVVLAIVQTWPLASDPAHLSRNDTADTVLNEWAIAWFAYQAPRDPRALFDANIFHPERDTLAYSEAMIVQSVIAAPLQWLGASPVLAYNLVALAGFALTGWATCLVLARWTGDWSAGLIAGVLNGVNAHTMTRLPHLQALHVEFLPFALLALDRLVREPRVGHAARLALWFTLQALTSIYLLVFTAFSLVAATLVRPDAWRGGRIRRVAPMALLSAAMAGLALLPFLLPYWRVYADQGLSRSLVDVEMYSASIADYLTTPGRLHAWLWSSRFSGTALFPGVIGLGLAVVAVATGVALRDGRARMCLAMGVVGVALSFGIRLPGYAALWEALPLLHAIRAPVRFGYLGVVAVAMLAGFGAVAIRRRVAPQAWPPLVAILVTMAAIETMAAPIGLSRFEGVPAIYATLRDEPSAVVSELPLPHPRAAFANARFMLNSTAHWKPMVNGYSGFVPASYWTHQEQIAGFPDARAIDALQALGVTHVFVHFNQLRTAAAEAVAGVEALQEVSREGSIALYRLRPD